MNTKMLAMSLGLLAITGTAISQELSIEANGGLQGLHYEFSGGSAKPQAGGTLGVGYMFRLHNHWNVLTGINGSYYATKATLNGTLPYSSFQVDDMGSAFQYNIKTTHYQEKQTFWAVTVPLMLQYHTTGEKTQWYINGGAKLLLPFGAKAKTSASELAVSGYYPDMNVEVKELPAHGFGTIQNWNTSRNLDLKTGAMASLATGVSFPFSSCMRLYIGVYADYGLENVYKKDGSGSLLPYNATGVNNIQPGTVLNMEGTGSAKPIAFGIQVKLGLGHKKSKSAPAVPVAETPAPKEQPELKVTKDTQAPAVPVVEVTQPAPAPTITAEEKATVQQPLEFGKIGNTSIPEGVQSRLDSIAGIMKKYPDMRVSIVGHTCDIAPAAINYKVGLKRAKAVASYLENKGISANRMDVTSKGETQPLVPNTSEQNRSINRRVTVNVYE